jgi:hypothetical protein
MVCSIALQAENGYEFAHRSGGFIERSFLVRRQFDLDDLFDSARAEFHRHTDKEAVDPVFEAGSLTRRLPGRALGTSTGRTLSCASW